MSYTLNKTGAQIDAILLRAEAGGAIDGAIALKAPLASPALTGTPTAPTAAAGTDTTQIATTEFVTDAVQAEAEADALRYAPAIVVPTSSAPVASFSDGADGVPLKSATFQIVPAQSGSGTPAPDNVRPISGWTAATIYRTGKNIFNDTAADWQNGQIINSNGGIAVNASYKYCAAYVPIKGGEDITLSLTRQATTGTNIAFYNKSKTFIERLVPIPSSTPAGQSGTVTAPANAAFFRISVGLTDSDIMLEYGATATAYEAYNGTAYAIDWQDAAGTVYGGTLEYKGNGAWKLTKTYARVDLGSLTWTKGVYNPAFNITRADLPAPISGGYAGWCEMYAISRSTTPTSQSYDDNAVYICNKAFSNNVRIAIFDSAAWAGMDETQFQTYVSGKYLVYPLATPTTYDLTGADVLTLLGTNNIWSDTGDAAVEYRADTKLYIDGQIAALQALVLENNG